MFWLGVGTVVYHSIPNTVINGYPLTYLMDDVPIVVTCTFLSSIYVWHLNKFLNKLAVFGTSAGLIGWMLFLIISIYFVSAVVRNAITVTLPVLIFTVYSFLVFGARSARVWLLLTTSLVIWLINRELCAQMYCLALFHAIYHIFISFSLWGAGCMGIELHYANERLQEALISMNTLV